MGGPDEAAYYLIEFGKALKDTPGAIDWLIDMTGPAARRRSHLKTRPRSRD